MTSPRWSRGASRSSTRRWGLWGVGLSSGWAAGACTSGAPFKQALGAGCSATSCAARPPPSRSRWPRDGPRMGGRGSGSGRCRCGTTKPTSPACWCACNVSALLAVEGGVPAALPLLGGLPTPTCACCSRAPCCAHPPPSAPLQNSQGTKVGQRPAGVCTLLAALCATLLLAMRSSRLLRPTRLPAAPPAGAPDVQARAAAAVGGQLRVHAGEAGLLLLLGALRRACGASCGVLQRTGQPPVSCSPSLPASSKCVSTSPHPSTLSAEGALPHHRQDGEPAHQGAGGVLE